MGENRYLITYIKKDGNEYKKDVKVITSFSFRAAVDSFCAKHKICNKKLKRKVNNDYSSTGWLACRMLTSSVEPTIG